MPPQSPPSSPPGSDVHAQRRTQGGARRASSLHVYLRRGSTRVAAWTLNISRGGLRVVVEDPLELEAVYSVLWDDDGSARDAKVVWVQDEPDGQVAGLQYLDAPSDIPPPMAPPRP